MIILFRFQKEGLFTGFKTTRILKERCVVGKRMKCAQHVLAYCSELDMNCSKCLDCPCASVDITAATI